MNTQTRQDRADEELRALLAQVDPEQGRSAEAPTHLLDRVLASAAAEGDAADRPAGTAEPVRVRPEASTARPSFLARHWQGALLAAATVATLALAAPTVLPGVVGGGSDDSATSVSEAAGGAGMGVDSGVATDGLARDSEAAASAPDMADGSKAAGSTVPGEDAQDQSLVRYGSLLVGTEDVEAARNAFVATVLGMGGRVTSETVVTEDGTGTVDPYVADSLAARSDMAVSYPYPWYPMGPGIWLSVQVPAADYDEAMEAARRTGEVIQMQQSSYDVGAQKSDVDARIEALEASLARLTALMDEAEDIADVIALEQAISQRQSELDALRAQQRELANQTAMSQISLTLMSPEDARQSVDPQPEQSWWESFLEGLGQFWAWLGSALLIVSPLLLATAIIWWVRRRRARRAATGGAAPAAADRQPTAPGAPQEPPSGQ